MLGSYILLLGVAAVLGSRVDREFMKDHINNYRVESQNLHVDHLEEEFEEVEEEFENLSDLPDTTTMRRLRARVRNLEDHHDLCNDHEVPCGGEIPQCVGTLLVCDGHKDCNNGRDEEDYVCALTPIHVGSTYRGLATWSDCRIGPPHYTSITIAATKTVEFFKARAYVKAVVTGEIPDDKHEISLRSYNARGYFDFARRRLVLAPEPGQHHHLGIACRFNLGDYDHADCTIREILSLHECGSLRVERT